MIAEGFQWEVMGDVVHGLCLEHPVVVRVAFDYTDCSNERYSPFNCTVYLNVSW